MSSSAPPTLVEVITAIDAALERIDRATTESADRHEADKHLAIEDVHAILSGIRARIPDHVAAALGGIPLWRDEQT